MKKSVQLRNSIRLDEVGARLQAYRLDRKLPPEQLAAKLGISRAAVYRAEKGEIAKVDLLVRIANVLEISLRELLGIAIEYIDGAVPFFRRVAQLEEESDQIIAFSGQIPYLLTSAHYDAMLAQAFEVLTKIDAETGDAVRELALVLRQRKDAYQRRRPLLVNIVFAAELERLLLRGLTVRDEPTQRLEEQRRKAKLEAMHLRELVLNQPIDVQIGILPEALPSTGFQLFRRSQHTVLIVSPYQLGDRPNLPLGAAFSMTCEEGIGHHEEAARQMWSRALKGQQAATFIDGLIERYGIVE
ncbi:helix-turn-helix protein [Rhizobium sp. BK251]|nr:helix-turn-helix protein [Rhizobium sp. BK251]